MIFAERGTRRRRYKKFLWRKQMEKEKTACPVIPDTRLSAAELSLVFGISERTVLMLAKAKELPFENECRVPVFSLGKLLQFLGNLEAAA
jgi:hypothetical protein